MRIQYVDRLKGLAIILVVMGHVGGFCFQEGVEMLSRFVGSFHMPLFMFLSGFVLKRESSMQLKRWYRRIGGLMLPLIIIGLCFSMYIMHIQDLEVIETFITSDNKMGYWYLFVLSLFYMTMPLYALNKGNRWWLDMVLAVGIEVVFYIGWMRDDTFADTLCLLNAASFYPFFIMGYMVRKYNMMDWLRKQNWIFTLSLLTFIVLFAFEPKNHAMHTLSWRLIQPITGILICLYFFEKRENESSLLESQLSFIGKHTLDVYVLHYFIVFSINLKVIGLWLKETDNALLATTLAIVITVPVTYCSVYAGKFIRKSKFVNEIVFGDIFRKK